MDSINQLNAEAKVALGLAVAEKMFSLIGVESLGYNTGKDALQSCWKWLAGEPALADDLCNYIDSPDDDNVAEFAHSEENLQRQYAWFSVLDAVSYTTYHAYTKENRRHVPQVIEMIDEDTLKILIENTVESGYVEIKEINKVIEYLLTRDSFGTDIRYSLPFL